ncbi:MAG: hypothetical protein J0H67_02115 [Rhodospirillales bacterium]|nr:hypothetical protein [Rhodospirillales bacterium]
MISPPTLRRHRPLFGCAAVGRASVTRRTAGGLSVLAALLALAAPAQAQNATTAGPGRIVCTAAKSCVLGIGTQATMHYQIDASGLAPADTQRLTKDCTAEGKPCVVTIDGLEDRSDPLKVKATKITWYN